MTTSIDEFKQKRELAKLDADIAEYDAVIAKHWTWLKEHPAAAAEHREMAQKIVRRYTSLRKRMVALREERRMCGVMLARAGGNRHARCIDLTDQAMAERAANPDAPLPSTRVDALLEQALGEAPGSG